MRTPGTLPGRANKTLGAVQVNVVDFKAFMQTEGIADEELDTVRAYVRKLIDSLRTYTTFMSPDEDKVVANIELKNPVLEGKMHLDLLLGKMDDPFIKHLELPLPAKFSGNTVADLHGALAAIDISIKRTMGSGDAVASVLSMVHLWDMERAMGLFRSAKHPIDAKFIEIAATVFVSLLSRFAGEILYHSNRCDWTGVPPEKFRDIVAATARRSLDLAAGMWNQIDQRPTVAREPEWDMDVAMWQL